MKTSCVCRVHFTVIIPQASVKGKEKEIVQDDKKQGAESIKKGGNQVEKGGRIC